MATSKTIAALLGPTLIASAASIFLAFMFWWPKVIPGSACERGVLVTIFQPATPHSDLIKRPDCPKCRTTMRLFGIEAERPGYELRSFECPKCNHIEIAIGRAP